MIHAVRNWKKLTKGLRDEISCWHFFASTKFTASKNQSPKNHEYFKSAAQRCPEVRKRILLLMGPVGGGKSMLWLWWNGDRKYKTGKLKRMHQNCLMHEYICCIDSEIGSPEIERLYGIWHRRFARSQYRPFTMSAYRRTPATRWLNALFSVPEKIASASARSHPSCDPKSQDITELTGSIDFLRQSAKSVSKAIRVLYRWDGYTISNWVKDGICSVSKLTRNFCTRFFNTLVAGAEH